jgi:hypothetical protein
MSFNKKFFTTGGIVASSTDTSLFSDWGGTFDPSNTYGNVSLTNGNKTYSKISSSYNTAWSTNGYNSGKYYFELKTLANELAFGLTRQTTAGAPFNTSFNNESIYYASWSTLSRAYSDTNTAQGAVLSTNDILGFAVDFDNTELKYYINGSLQHTVTLQSGTHYFFVSDGGNQSSSANLHSVSGEFVETKP